MLDPKRPKRRKLKYVYLQVPSIWIVIPGIMRLLSWVAIYVISDLKEQTTDMNAIYHIVLTAFDFFLSNQSVFFL